MNKRCTNPECRKVFSTLEYGGRCPHCGKVYPNLYSRKEKNRDILYPVPVKLPGGNTVRVPGLFVPRVEEIIGGERILVVIKKTRRGEYKGIKYYTSLKEAKDFCVAIRDGRQPCMNWAWSGKVKDSERELLPWEQIFASKAKQGHQEEAKKHPWTGNPKKVGGTVIFGRYPQEGDGAAPTGIEWKVLDVQGGRSLLISRYALDVKRYNEEWEEDVTWESCTLRTWLNQEFLQKAFTREEQGVILTSTVENPDNPYSKTEGGNDTKDRVFLLSIGEAEQYFSSDEERLCNPTKYALSQNINIIDEKYGAGCFWWLRSPGGNSDRAASVWPDGSVSDAGYSVDRTDVAVRPALWLNLSS